MRVLVLLAHSFPTQMALWEEAAARPDVDLHLAYTVDIPRGAAVAAPRFGVAHELPIVRARGDRLTWMLYRRLRRLVASVNPDVVHVLNEPWSLVATQAVRIGQAAVVIHGSETIWDQGSSFEAEVRRRVTHRNLGKAGGFISWSKAGVAWARRWGLPADRPSAVISAELPDLERFARPEVGGTTRPTFGGDDEVVVGYVGRFVLEKGIEWLLDAWRSADLSDRARLVFVGTGPLEGAIRDASRSDGRIRVVPPVPLTDVPMVMASLDALVVPSLTTGRWCEQYGRVITEAMASGVPVVASRSGAIPEVAGDAAVLVEEGSRPQLGAALSAVVDDPDHRRRLARAGVARAHEEFSPAVRAPELVGFWHRVVGRTTPHDEDVTASG